jgi:DNA-binding NarL/FixJ family response regulator
VHRTPAHRGKGNSAIVQPKINVLIADDQQRARKSLKALLSTLAWVDRIYEASNGREAVQLVQEIRPDVVLMDMRMPVMDGQEATQTIKSRWPQVRVIILSMYADCADAALAAGADAFVSKGDAPERLLEVLDTRSWMGEGGYSTDG